MDDVRQLYIVNHVADDTIWMGAIAVFLLIFDWYGMIKLSLKDLFLVITGALLAILWVFNFALS